MGKHIKSFNEHQENSNKKISYGKRVSNFMKDLFSEPKCEVCGEEMVNVRGGGISMEPAYVCLNKKCENGVDLKHW